MINFTTNLIKTAAKESSTALRGATNTFAGKSTKVNMSDNLIMRTTGEQRNILSKLYHYYTTISKNKVSHPASNLIEKGSLLHSQSYNLDSIRATLKDGLISGDIGKTLRTSNGEQRTIGGLDTWIADKSRTIEEYFREWLATPPSYANTPFRKLNRSTCWRGENKWMDLASGGKRQENIAYIINPKKHKELEEFLKYKVTPDTKNLPETLMGGKMTEGMYDTPDFARHTFVPVGIPANYIEKIVVGDKITPSEISEIQKIITELGLDIKIYSTSGKLHQKSLSGAFFSKAGVEAENLLRRYRFDLFGKNGLPLQYSRQEFINDVAQVTHELPTSERAEFLKKFGLKPGNMDIEGFPNIKNFTASSPQEQKMVELIEKFYSNEININNPNMKPILDSILKEFPEFNMVIGKVQHGTHAYSVDIHSLNLLQKAMSHPAYSTLDGESRQVLKLTTLMHDFGKKGGVITPGHAKASREYAEQILAEHNITQNIKERVLNQIEYHHWFEAYNTGRMTSKQFGEIFKTAEDRTIAMLIAKGDFESVNPTFHLNRMVSGQSLTPAQYEECFDRTMQKILSEINS